MTEHSKFQGMSSEEADLRAELDEVGELEYGQQRLKIADRYKIPVKDLDRIRTSTRKGNASVRREFKLPSINPWPAPVDGSDVLDGLYEAIRTYVVIDEAPLAAVALWIVHAHAHDAAPISPILLITAATKGCGKSTLLDVIARLVPRPLLSAATTAAALYRSAPTVPTILCDEGDTYLGRDSRLLTFFNAGHRRGVPFRLVEGENNEPVEYPSWCPKAIAQIGLPREATIVDRSVVVDLRRKKSGETCENFSSLEPYPELADLARQCARWARDNSEPLRRARPTLPDGFANRLADNWKPLLAIAERAGGAWPNRARRAAQAIGSVEDEDLGTLLLTDFLELFEQRGVIFTDDAVAMLTAISERPWSSLRRGQGIDGNWIARVLKSFGIRPERVQNGRGRRRGYHRAQFADAWTRYLPTDPDDVAGIGSGDPAVPANPSRDAPIAVDDPDGTDKPREGLRPFDGYEDIL